MITERSTVGRAKTVLVFGHDDEAVAVLSTIVARSIGGAGNERLVFTGPATFDETATGHIVAVVLPVVDSILQLMAIPSQRFELSVVNLAAASAENIGLTVSGFSADVPVLLALLSAALQMPVPQDVVATGHVASPDGDLRPVKNIPAKLDAALHEQAIGRFIYAFEDEDYSLKTLSPNEREQIVEAIGRARGDLRTIEVADVDGLLRAVFADETIVLASLRVGFFGNTGRSWRHADPTGRAAQFLLQDNDRRFWSTLQQHLLAGRTDEVRELLLERAQYQVSQKVYPGGLGCQLLQLVRSLPPATRRLKTVFPLLPMDRCIELGRFATETDHEDLRQLIDATSGNAATRERPPRFTADGNGPASTDAAAALDAVLSEISSETLAQKIGLPIDAARAAYAMDVVTIESNQAFNDTISAFYLHVLRHTGAAPAPVDSQAVADEAFSLLARAFANKGGEDAARAEGRFAVSGGMRFVLDVMTEQLKSEKQGNHVHRVLKDAVDPLDWDDRVAFMAVLLDRIGPQLPPELRNRSPRVYARQYHTIVQAYVKSLDRVKDLLRTL